MSVVGSGQSIVDWWDMQAAMIHVCSRNKDFPVGSRVRQLIERGVPAEKSSGTSNETHAKQKSERRVSTLSIHDRHPHLPHETLRQSWYDCLLTRIERFGIDLPD